MLSDPPESLAVSVALAERLVAMVIAAPAIPLAAP